MLTLCAVLALLGLGVREAPTRQTESSGSLQWIWFNEGNPLESAPVGTRYFRKSFTIDRPFAHPTDEAFLDITADDAFKVWFNGKLVGAGDTWRKVYRFDVNNVTVPGKNTVAVEAKNTGSAAGLLVRLGYIPNGQSRLAVLSDGTWKSAKTAAPGWEQPGFDDSRWSSAKALGEYGKVGPWQNLTWAGGGNERFTVPKGFVVEEVVPPLPESKYLNPRLPFSLINMCFDDKGRLLVSQERGPVLLCTDPNKRGVFQTIKPYCSQVKSCQGMCWVRDALLLVGDGPQGTGLYRVRDTQGKDVIDQVELLHRFRGSMGEHGPHAILHGPDDWLYVVTGNHAWAQPEKLAANSPLTRWPKGTNGFPQNHPQTTEDILLPRLEDARGHAVGIHAPGGTIWRMDHNGKNLSLVNAGFRNHFDAAFNRQNELFTFDSDMEWDEALPWYRPVRVVHCPPGGDFLWRNGAGNTPNYYIDSLPPMHETGRGSPVGIEAYDHTAFPAQYRNAIFMGDWALGVIYAVYPQRADASFTAHVERFCEGVPMNVTDLAVGPDGALYFCLGGRGTAGGVYRIVHKGAGNLSGLLGGMMKSSGHAKVEQALQMPQPLAAYSRAKLRALRKEIDEQTWTAELTKVASFRFQNIFNRMRALDLMQEYGPKPTPQLLCRLAHDDDSDDNDHPFVRAHAVYLLGVNGYPEGKREVIEALKDGFPLVRRRACEAIIRAGYEVPVENIWYLLADQDPYIRTAARLVLQRIPVEKWLGKLPTERSDHIAMEAIVALCKTDQARANAEVIAQRLAKMEFSDNHETLLDQLRTWQLVFLHTNLEQIRPQARAMVEQALKFFPQTDPAVNRELAILLTHARRSGLTEAPVHRLLLQAILGNADRQQQIYFFYCLRLLHQGWSAAEKTQFLQWFESTKEWRGGYSFGPFLENMFRDLQPVFTPEDRVQVMRQREQLPHTLRVLLFTSRKEQLPPTPLLMQLYEEIRSGDAVRTAPLRELIIQLLGRRIAESDAQAALRKIAELDPSQRDNVARSLALHPRPENWPILVQGLESKSPVVILQSIRSLQKIDLRPKEEEAKPYRLLLLASRQLNPGDRWEAVKLLRQWGKKKFATEEGDWITELTAWATWFAQTFPKEPPLPNATALTATSKWKFDELLSQLDKAQGKGDPERGRKVFDKANCQKCHKFGSLGEGIGPDLTTLKSRFKRADILESLIYPSKVISDQYRGSTILTKQGQILNGLVAQQGNQLTVLQTDGTKVTLQKSEVESMVNSTTSPMPERTLDELTLQEIIDLFAFLEGTPPK
jgi:putative heme-binding domain-containing protein